MDSESSGFPSSLEGFEFDDQINFPGSDHSLDIGNGFGLDDPSLDFSSLDVPFISPDPNPQNSVDAWNGISEGDSVSPSDDNDFSDSVLKYISQMLMEDDMEEKPCMFHDALALQAAEESLYEALGEKYPPSPNQPPLYPEQNADTPDGSCSGGFSDNGGNISTTSSTTTSTDSHWSFDVSDNRPSWLQTPIPSNFVFQATSKSSGQPPFNFSDASRVFGSSLCNDLVSNIFSESEMVMQFQKGVEEASKFLPKGNQLVIDFKNYTPAVGLKEKNPSLVFKTEKDEREQNSSNRLTEKKIHEREDEHLDEERSNKQPAVYVDESELSEMLDKVLLSGGENEKPVCILQDRLGKRSVQNGRSLTSQQNGQGNGTASRDKKPGKEEIVGLRTLLTLCVQAVSGDDRRTSYELLKQVRQHSSPFGDGSQRLAHYFANGLEARLDGTGAQIYTSLSSKKASSSDMLKAYQTYLSFCPFKKIAIIFANHNIMHMTWNAKTLHIIDFGISYGFQWPALIHRLAWRPEGPPKLRVTGIELPQRGFRPAEGVQETGRRLARYCERYKVPFEYNAIAQKWETIKVKDLKINRNEFVVVNCLFRFKNLLDETVMVNSPRDAVFNLIKKIKPNIFIQAILSGSYNAPLFVSRFRESLYHYYTLFDMFDANLGREDQMRIMFEKEFYGREIMNVVACEGTERVERPETYKQWQVRTRRAGFKQLSLEPELIQKLKCYVDEGYHKDFGVDEDGSWLLQGWKGRVVYASSAWVPS